MTHDKHETPERPGMIGSEGQRNEANASAYTMPPQSNLAQFARNCSYPSGWLLQRLRHPSTHRYLNIYHRNDGSCHTDKLSSHYRYNILLVGPGKQTAAPANHLSRHDLPGDTTTAAYRA
jgi:hypothetical protein